MGLGPPVCDKCMIYFSLSGTLWSCPKCCSDKTDRHAFQYSYSRMQQISDNTDAFEREVQAQPDPFIVKLRTALKGYPDSDLISLAEATTRQAMLADDLYIKLKDAKAVIQELTDALEHCRHRPHQHNPGPDFTITDCDVINRALQTSKEFFNQEE